MGTGNEGKRKRRGGVRREKEPPDLIDNEEWKFSQ